MSFAGPSSAPPDPAFEHIHEPGGFRRNFVLLRANEQGVEEPRILNNFIDFLYIFGHFVSPLEPWFNLDVLSLKAGFRQAGEDLEEDSDEEKDDEESAVARPSSALFDPDEGLHEVAERTPLLSRSVSRSISRSRRRRHSIGPHGNATVTQAVLMVCLLPPS